MSLSRVLFCLPSEILTPAATLSLLAGTPDAAFPLTNAQDGKASSPFKATGTSCTIRSHFASPKTLAGVVLAYHNLAGATVTVSNPAGLSVSMPIPANTEDGHCLDPWLDLRDVDNTTDDDWDIAISGAAANVAIGELIWIAAWHEAEMDLRSPGGDDVQPAIIQPGDFHPAIHRYGMGTRVRSFDGHVTPSVSSLALLSLHRSARGPVRPFVVIPDTLINDALYVTSTTTRHRYRETSARHASAEVMREVDVSFTETIRGLAL